MLMIKTKKMKTTISLSSLLMILALLMSSMTVAADDMLIITKKKYSKTIDKQFKISKSGEVAVINKYGMIDMHTWDKNEVQFVVEIVVNATSESVAEDVFKTIDIKFSDSGNLVSAETVIESKESYWWNWGKNLKSDFEINYKIFMPATCSIDFSNKYGDVNLMDLENNAKLDVKYGHLTMGDLEGNLNLTLGYGGAFIGNTHDLVAEIGYSKFRCESSYNFTGETKYSHIILNKTEKMTVSSKYDNYQLGELGEFINEGKYDNFIIENCGKITISTKYTDVKIGSLTKAVGAELKYGALKIAELQSGFDKIVVDADYASVIFGLDDYVGFELILDSRYVDVKVPESYIVEDEKDGSERSLIAKRKGKKVGKIMLDMDYGQLKIK